MKEQYEKPDAAKETEKGVAAKGGVFRTQGELAAYQEALAGWFRFCGRDYPWRRTCDPYAILVSETMLQQTQIATVLGRGYYSRWMEVFPHWEALAAAREEEVLKLWEGLGYYNRARNLQKVATIVIRDHGGRLPGDLESLLALPGVGRYTAGAVMSFAFNTSAPIVDGNVSRFFSRLFACEVPVDTPEGSRLAWARAEALTPLLEPRTYNSAVMELGQRICTRTSPDCPACPVEAWCEGRRRGEEARFPIRKGRPQVTPREEHVILAVREGKVLLCPESGTRRKGLWRLPEAGEEAAADLEEVVCFDYAITRYRVRLRVFLAVAGSVIEAGGGGARWFALAREDELPPLGSPYRKALRLFAEIREDLKELR